MLSRRVSLDAYDEVLSGCQQSKVVPFCWRPTFRRPSPSSSRLTRRESIKSYQVAYGKILLTLHTHERISSQHLSSVPFYWCFPSRRLAEVSLNIFFFLETHVFSIQAKCNVKIRITAMFNAVTDANSLQSHVLLGLVSKILNSRNKVTKLIFSSRKQFVFALYRN
jgi:hypothetical protein